MLIDAKRSLLLVVDVQEKLVGAVHEHEQLVSNTDWLMRVARAVGVPVAASEQYPKGLGPTIAPLRALVDETAVADKVHFSCLAGGCMERLPHGDRPQVVIAGIEAHVCVLQTAVELKRSGREVFVVADCVSSRSAADRDTALARMRDLEIAIVTREMALFEWAHQADAGFRQLSREFLRG